MFGNDKAPCSLVTTRYEAAITLVECGVHTKMPDQIFDYWKVVRRYTRLKVMYSRKMQGFYKLPDVTYAIRH